MSQHMITFTFGSQIVNKMLISPAAMNKVAQPSNILVHFIFCGSQWRWMCPLHYSSFWVKWWTHVSQRYNGYSDSALQGMPSISTNSWALCKNGTRKFTNETVIPMISVLCYIFTCRWTPFVIQTIHSILCWLQHIGQIKIYSESNIRYLIKHWKCTNSSSSYYIT